MAGRQASEESKKLGLKIKSILKSKGISQEQAALTLGLSAQAVFNNYINGRSEIPISVLVGLINHFDISPLDLFDLGSQTNAAFMKNVPRSSIELAAKIFRKRRNERISVTIAAKKFEMIHSKN